MIQFLLHSFSGLRKEVWLLSLVILVNRAGMMVLPFMGLYFLNDLGFSKFQAGVLGGSFGIGALAGSFLGGHLADKYGPYRVMLVSLIGGAIGLGMMGLITSYVGLFIWILLTALIGDLVRPASFAALANYCDESNLTRGISLLRIAINLGISIGPAVGGFLVYAHGYQWIFIMDGTTCIFAAILLYLLLRHMDDDVKEFTAEEISNARSPYADSTFLMFMLLNILCLVGFFQIMNVTPVYFKEVFEITEKEIGWFFTANGLIIFFLEMPIIYWIEKRGYKFGPLIIGGVMIAFSYLSFYFIGDMMWALILHTVLISVGEIINFPFITSICMIRADEASKGKYMGAVTACFSFAFLIAPLVGLPVQEIVGYDIFWWLVFGLITFSLIGIYWIRPKFELN